ncbi:MAG: DUF1992 domain-containing protein [Calditrichaeota bacterium]|nr:DUF1992 domain-containing protein [Calditrichota bacterium]
MFLVEKIAEEKIAQAQADGLFDDLPLKGTPYRFDGYLYENPSERLFYKILKDHRFLPLPLELKKKIEEQYQAIHELLETVRRAYCRRFQQIVELLGVDLYYPPENYYDHLKAHHRFLQNDLKIWLAIKCNSRTQLAIQMFNKMQKSYALRFQEMVVQLLDLIDEYNEEVIKLCLKDRDRFRVMTTLGKVPVRTWLDQFNQQFPLLPEHP